jgi:hypothetical protein
MSIRLEFVAEALGGTIRASLDTLVRAARRHPSSAFLHAAIVDFASRAPDTTLVRAAAREAIRLAPRDGDVLATVSSGVYGINDIALADSLVTVVAALDPGSVETLRYQLQIAYQRGDTAEMGRRYESIVRAVGPLDPSLWYLRHGTMAMQHVLDTVTIRGMANRDPQRIASLLSEKISIALARGRDAEARAPFHCQKSAVFGLLGLVDSLLPALRTCVDGVWSTPAWFMAREPELARVKHDLRVAALLEELWAERKSVLKP